MWTRCCWNSIDSPRNSRRKTIFFGGGTPSLLPTPLMRRILEAVGERGSAGATLRSGPSNAIRRRYRAEKAKLFREFGVNRISMGVQALDDELLEKIGTGAFGDGRHQILREAARGGF